MTLVSLFLGILLCVWIFFYPQPSSESFLEIQGSRFEYPTRNMSYDLRGDAYFPPRTNFPFDNSEIGPSNHNCQCNLILI
jgi:hypothetical protein